MKITERQRNALASLSLYVEQNAYGLRVGLNTLSALERRGLVKSRHELGSIAFPHNNIIWRITDAGREALASS